MSIQNDPNLLVDQKFIGIPYKLGQRALDGADCIGVCLMWLENQGIKYDYDDAQGPVLEHWWEKKPRRFIDAVLQHGALVKLSEIRQYDVLMFILGNEGNSYPSCLAVMIDDRHFLIATPDRGSFVSMMNMVWKEKFWGAVRLYKAIEKVNG